MRGIFFMTHPGGSEHLAQSEHGRTTSTSCTKFLCTSTRIGPLVSEDQKRAVHEEAVLFLRSGDKVASLQFE